MQQTIAYLASCPPEGTSALFVVVRDADPAAAVGALKPYKGRVYETSFDEETEEELRNVLK